MPPGNRGAPRRVATSLGSDTVPQRPTGNMHLDAPRTLESETMDHNVILAKSSDTPRQCRSWRAAGVEPPLGEVLADPLVEAVMRRDGLDRAMLESVIAQAQQRLRARAAEIIIEDNR
jgi:hypothetical protein